MTYFNSHTGKAQNCINKPRNSIGWDLFSLSLLPRLQCSGFIDISLFVVSTLHVVFWPDFAPPSGNTKDGPKGRCPEADLNLSVLCHQDRLQRPTVTAPCYSVAVLLSVQLWWDWWPQWWVIGQRMKPHHCTTWILMVPIALVQQESKRCSQVNGWPGIQKAFGIVNSKSSEVPTVCLKSCQLVPQIHRCAASWRLEREGFSWGHTATLRSGTVSPWRPWEHLTVSVGWVCETNQCSWGQNQSRTKTWNGERKKF